MIKGSCLCGKVNYQIDGNISDIVHCHCETCRKAHSAAFSSVAAVSDKKFSLTGAQHLNSFESSAGKHRFFCQHCGSQIYAKRDNTQHVVLRVGSIDGEVNSKELAHTWVSDKASWHQVNQPLPAYDEGYPNK